jgi:hypothetical protein
MSDPQSDSASDAIRKSVSSNDEDFSPPMSKIDDEDFSPRLKLRRCRSTSKAETIVTEEEKMRRAQPDKP